MTWGVSRNADDPTACVFCLDDVPKRLARGMYASVSLGVGLLENAGDHTGEPVCRGHMLPVILVGCGVAPFTKAAQ